MSKEQIRIDVSNYLKTNWTTTPIDYPNVTFNQPKTEWVKLRFAFGDDKQISMGSSYDGRTELIIGLSLFAKVDSGTSKLMQYADTLSNSFRTKDIGVVHTRLPSVNIIGNVSGTDWYQINVLVPSYIDTEYLL